MKRILVTLDFKGKDFKSLEVAKEMGRAFNAEIILLNVDPIEVDKESLATAPVMAHRLDVINDMINENVKNVEGKLGGDIFKFRHILKSGAPHEQILKVAKEEDVDVIIMGSNKHSGAYRFLIGSVADQVVKKTTIPVLLVPYE
ncbi:MAG TPA: universal stress protein [Moheibacter sp.]|nr:universal stress protein [Moheibacter sp.]